MSTYWEGMLGCLTAGGGVVWLITIASQQLFAAGMVFPTGPIEVCALGIVIWLHAKWRGSVKRV